MSVFVDNGHLIFPAQTGFIVSSTHNNVNPGVGVVAYSRQMAIGAVVTGFSGGEANRVLIIQPTRNTPEDINFAHNSVSSSVGNRLLNGQNATTVAAFWGSCVMYVYDSVDGFWKEVG